MVSTNTRKEEEMTTHITDRDDAVQLQELPALSGIDRLALAIGTRLILARGPFRRSGRTASRRQNS